MGNMTPHGGKHKIIKVVWSKNNSERGSTAKTSAKNLK